MRLAICAMFLLGLHSAADMLANGSLLGNGRLTITTDTGGALTSVTWPAPSHFEQLSQQPGAPAPGTGAAWAAILPGPDEASRFRWLSAATALPATGGSASTPEMHDSLHTLETGAQFRTRTYVHPTVDLLICQLIPIAKGPGQVIWWQDLSPRTHVIPGIPGAQWPQALRDFAAFATPSNELVHFRPQEPGAANWLQAVDNASALDNARWDRLGNGTWTFTRGLGAEVRVSCGEPAGMRAWQRHYRNAPLSAAVGEVEGALLIDLPPGEAGALVLIGFGASLEAARAAVDYGTQRGAAALLRETEAHWEQWLTVSPPPGAEAAAPWCSAVVRLGVSIARDTGAIAVPITAAPATRRFDPLRAGLPLFALQSAGQLPAVERVLHWYFDLVVQAHAAEPPLRSQPPVLYAHGVPAFPSYLVDLAGPAWTMAVAQRHATILEEEARVQFCTEVLGAVLRLGDLLASWMHGGTGDLLPAYDRQAGRDTVTQEGRLTVWMGLECARLLVSGAGEIPPETWQGRQRELETQLRFQALHREAPWNIDPMLFLVLDRVLPDQRAVWGPLLAGEGHDAVSLRTHLETVSAGAEPQVALSAHAAALHCLAAATRVYGSF